ncbi:MAG: peptidylprolyl isomerase, partial [Candidatus Omnitrophota bacterium]
GWSQELLSLINKSKAGPYLNPINIDKSYYIFRIKERKEPYIPDFDSIKNKIKEALIKEKSQFIAKEIIENCLISLKKLYAANPKKIDFNKQAKKFGLKSAVLDSFKSRSYLEGIGSSDKFWTAADKLKENEFSGVLDMPSGFYIIRLKSKTPIDEKKFDTEKADFAQKILLQKKQDVFNKFMEGLKKQRL